jgi:hypothetical protein
LPTTEPRSDDGRVQRIAAASLTVLGALALGQTVRAADGGVPSAEISRDEAAVLAAVFKRAVADPKTIPDGQLLGLRPQVWVREEFGESGSRRIPKELMAPLSGWSLGSLQTLQGQADAIDQIVYFMVVNNLTINAATATIE